MSHRLATLAACVGLCLLAEPCLAQAPPVDPALANLDLIVKIVGGVVAGLAALIGLPLVLFTYRKTKAEIRKLELEARNLEAQGAGSVTPAVDSDGILISVENSPGVRVHVMADPRFLAPLLLLVDFVLAWIVLTLADRWLSVFLLEGIRPYVIAILAGVLLLPMAKQVLQVRAVLQPPQSLEEVLQASSLARVGVYASWTLSAAALVGLAGLYLLIEKPKLGSAQFYFGSAGLALGVVLGVAFAVLRKRIDKLLASLVGGNRFT